MRDGSAAATVKHRGVTVTIYGPLADRKRETFLLAYYVGSRRVKQTSRGTLADAQRRAKEIAGGISVGDVVDGLHLTPLDRRVYLTAKEIAGRHGRAVDGALREWSEALHIIGSGVSLAEAARFYANHHQGALPSATVEEVTADLLLYMEKTKRRDKVTVSGLRGILRKFGQTFGRESIAHIQGAEIERWLGSLHLAPVTLNNHRSGIVRLFNFAKGRYLPRDKETAAAGLERVNEERGEISTFKPWELSKLLSVAPEELLPAIAIGAFAGLRNCELCRIEWSDIHFDDTTSDMPHGYVRVRKSAAKQHRAAATRDIAIQPNLAKWLEPYRFQLGPVSPYRGQASLSRAITRTIRALNVIEKKAHRHEIGRPANGLRHSYATYRLPVVKNIAALALEMNNSESEIWENYRSLATAREVADWWNLYPATITQLEFPIESAAGGC